MGWEIPFLKLIIRKNCDYFFVRKKWAGQWWTITLFFEFRCFGVRELDQWENFSFKKLLCFFMIKLYSIRKQMYLVRRLDFPWNISEVPTECVFSLLCKKHYQRGSVTYVWWYSRQWHFSNLKNCQMTFLRVTYVSLNQSSYWIGKPEMWTQSLSLSTLH